MIKPVDGLHKTTIDTIEGIYTVEQPITPSPLILDSPHSGQCIPDDFNYICDDNEISKTKDHFVDELFADAPKYGASLLTAQFPRAYLDLNRKIDDIDPEIYAGLWPVGKEGYVRPAPSNRSYAGIGLIRRLIKPDMPVYNMKLSPDEIQARINTYYIPYYKILEKLIEDAHAKHGKIWHINCHSMPSSSVKNTSSIYYNPAPQIDFVLGNQDGKTCGNNVTKTIKNKLKDMGYHVAINAPYKGVELVERFSNPALNRHSIQIEINKALYLDEKTGKKSKNFENLRNDLNNLIKSVIKQI